MGQDAGFDGYVICPYCFNAEQINPKIGVIKCIKCSQVFNNPLAKPAPNGIRVEME